MRARKTSTEIRREQIARAALGVVERHGLRGLNVARVARAVRVVPSALYRHYPGKDDMLDAVLDSIAARLSANVDEIRKLNGNALSRLQSLLARHVEWISRDSAIPRVVFSDELLHGQARQRRRMYAIIQDYLRQVEQLLRDGQREGSVRADVDAQAASLLFLGLIQPAVVLRALSHGAFDVRTHAEAGWKLFVTAVS